MTPESEPQAVSFRIDEPDINFVGRFDELKTMKEALQHSTDSSPQRPQIIVVSGLGGIGKTQLARKFINDNQSCYKNVIWINSATSGLIEGAFTTLAETKLNMKLTTNIDFRSIVELVFGKLSTSTLFVYDNVDNINDIKFAFTMKTLGKRFHVVITSRIRDWSENIEVISLKVWNSEEALAYVSKTLKDRDKSHEDTDEDKMSLAEKLQYFPLAMRQATAHINHQRVERIFHIVDYVSLYDTQKNSKKEKPEDAQKMLDSKFFKDDIYEQYEKTTFTTWCVTIDAIKGAAVGELAVRILRIMAYFDPDNIGRCVFFCLMCEPETPNDGEQVKEESVRSAVRLLINYSMIDGQKHQSILHIHRLVQKVTKIELENLNGGGKSILRDGLIVFDKLTEHEHNTFHENHQHAISIFISALDHADLVEEFSELPVNILASLVEKGKYRQAVGFAGEIVQPLTNVLSEHHHDVLITKNQIGISYLAQGMYANAVQIFEEVFEQQRHILGEYDSATLSFRGNLAMAYSHVGKLTEALQTFKEIVEVEESVLGIDHPETLRSQSNIADIHLRLGEYDEARQMFETVFEKRKAIFGEDHPETLRSQFELAIIYNTLGKYNEALLVSQQVFEKNLRVLGKDHPQTLAAQHSVASSCSRLGKDNEVTLRMFQEILEKKKLTLGNDHPETLNVQIEIAELHRKLGKYEEALQMNQEVFEKQKNILGSDHPDTLTSQHNTACLHAKLGKHSEAIEILTIVLEKLKKDLGDDHPNTLLSQQALASSYVQLKRSSDALEMFLEIFEKQKKCLGTDHPMTLATQQNISLIYSSQGKTALALEMVKEVFEKIKNAFGENDSNTLTVQNNLANTQLLCGGTTDALKTFEEVYEKRKCTLGEDHPDTILSRDTLQQVKSGTSEG